MKVCFLTREDPLDQRSWSGIHYHAFQSLRGTVDEVVPLGPLEPRRTTVAKAANTASQLLLGKRYNYRHSWFLAEACASKAREAIDRVKPDVVFSMGSLEIADLDVDVPIVYSTDATFELLLDYYHGYDDLLERSRREGHEIEQAAIDKADMLVYPTEWAARSAIEDYGAAPDATHVVPYGANLENEPHPASEDEAPLEEPVELLFIGADWGRKGGPIAVSAVEELRERDVDARLTICGCDPDVSLPSSSVRIVGYLDKNDPQDLQRLRDLYRESDLFFLPTRAECYGIVFVEANAFGLPVLTTATGGVPDVVADGENGFALPPEAGSEAYADLVERLLAEPPLYRRVREGSRQTFREDRNWSVWASTVRSKMRKLTADEPRS
jgi:glycosyltransferase involved in cell wall biosynthesis